MKLYKRRAHGKIIKESTQKGRPHVAGLIAMDITHNLSLFANDMGLAFGTEIEVWTVSDFTVSACRFTQRRANTSI